MAKTDPSNDDSLKNLFSSTGAAKRRNFEVTPDVTPVARIKVFGVGGGGGNASTA